MNFWQPADIKMGVHMSLSDYFDETIKVYSEVNSGTHIMPVITWTLTDTFLAYWETADGRTAVTNQNSEIRADINLICDTSNVPDYKKRLLLSDDEIYEIAFADPDAANRGHHSEVLLKRMTKDTKAVMGL